MKTKPNHVILLYKDHVIRVADDGRLNDIRKCDDIEYCLIPVGVYSPQYMILKPNQIVKGFKKFAMQGTLCLEMYSKQEDFGSCERIKELSFECNTLAEFYQRIHSLVKLNGYGINFISDFSRYSSFLLKGVKLAYTYKKGKSKIINVDNESSTADSKPISYILSVINYMVFGDSKKPVIPICTDKIILNIKDKSWYDKDDVTDSKRLLLKDSLISFSDDKFGTVTFIPYKDSRLLEVVAEASLRTIVYMDYPHNEVPEEVYEMLNGDSVYDWDGDALEVLLDDYSDLTTSKDVVSVLNNFKYIYQCKRIWADIFYGNLKGIHIILEVGYLINYDDMIEGQLSPANYYSCHGNIRPRNMSYLFTVNEYTLEGKDDVYEDFLTMIEDAIKEHDEEED
jgi:hypothetical protein